MEHFSELKALKYTTSSPINQLTSVGEIRASSAILFLTMRGRLYLRENIEVELSTTFQYIE